MKLFIYSCFILLFMSFHTSAAQQLNNLSWEKRILIVKCRKPVNKFFSKQMDEIKKDKEGIIERKLVLYAVQNEQVEFIDFDTSTLKNLTLENFEASTKKLLKHQSAFEIILIGLDGTVKLRQDEYLALNDLYALIDGMPMRRAELRNKNR